MKAVFGIGLQRKISNHYFMPVFLTRIIVYLFFFLFLLGSLGQVVTDLGNEEYLFVNRRIKSTWCNHCCATMATQTYSVELK